MIEKEKKYIVNDLWLLMYENEETTKSQLIWQSYLLCSKSLEIRMRKTYEIAKNNEVKKYVQMGIKFLLKGTTSKNRVEIEFRIPHFIWYYFAGKTIVKSRYFIDKNVTVDIYHDDNYPLQVLEIEDPGIEEFEKTDKFINCATHDVTHMDLLSNRSLFITPFSKINKDKLQTELKKFEIERTNTISKP